MADLVFPDFFDDRFKDEAVLRGYADNIKVKTVDGKIYPVSFYDIGRLKQDLNEEMKNGCTFISEPGLIILSEVTVSNMQLAIDKLEAEGFFSYLAPEC